jgi:NAD(P)-dependent dehydrogenase (short-subunit alcohol dehydrogenase family)
MSEFARRVALVSGCSTGIGREVARLLAAGGWTVVAGARDPSTLADLAAAHPESLHPVAWDLTDPDATREAVGSTIARHGAIDLLVNNAGYGQMGPLVEVSREEWRRQLETNVIGLADAAAIAARLPGGMIDRRRGRIVNIGSVVGLQTIPFGGAYCASKHAVEAISDALRMELAPFGIEVVLVEPGPVISRFGDTARASVASMLSRKGGPYEHLREMIVRRTQASQDRGMATAACGARIVRAATRPGPPTRLLITWQARAFILASMLLPRRALDAILKRGYGLHRRAP